MEIALGVVLIVLIAYAAFGIKFAVTAGINEKAMGHAVVVTDLLLLGAFWLPLLISDPKDFTSVQVLRIREERREQKNHERDINLTMAQTETVHRRVAVERSRAELEAQRTQAEAEIDRHRDKANAFIDQRMHKELAASSKVTDEIVDVEIVPDYENPKLPKRYQSLREQGGEEQVFDIEDEKWVPKWAMLPGYRYQAWQ